LSGGGALQGHDDIFEKIISLENILAAWKEFRRGKRNKRDVQEFEYTLEENLFEIHALLKEKKYEHGPYQSFFVCDPKLRHIHKASVRDRVIHQAVFRILYPLFDAKFIHDSYSCRVRKGTHRGVTRLISFCNKVSNNNTQNAFALKCDIKKFFQNIHHDVLRNFLRVVISDDSTLWLLNIIINSYQHTSNIGLPLGNVTSQLFANVYLNEFDQFVKHTLKKRYFIRYCDDFAILDCDREQLVKLIPIMQGFLSQRLKLSLHPNKVIIRKLSQGIDFLGYVVVPHATVLRTKTKRRTFRKLEQKICAYNSGNISEENLNHSLQSYLGILSHANAHRLRNDLLAWIQEHIKKTL
jgi:retron-type reverse transcriptase